MLPDLHEDQRIPLKSSHDDEMSEKVHQLLRDDSKERNPFLSKTSLNGVGLSSRASMVSLKSTLTKVNSEWYPERGSFVGQSLGHSLAELPKSIAKKMYIITQVLAAISVSMGAMAIGFNSAYTSPALASMDSQNSTLTLSAEQKSWIGSLLPLSALTGSIIGGYLVDAIGRKMLIHLCGPVLFSAMLVIGSATDVMMVYIGRSMAGLCVGILSLTLPIYLCETIQPEIRGILSLLPTSIGNLGILLCYFIGSYVNWSWLAYIGALIPLIFFILMIFVPETPRWYVSKGQIENGKESLLWLRGTESDVALELEAIRENHELSKRQSDGSFKDIFKRQNVKPVSIAIGLMVIQQLSGINAVIFYTVDIFKLSGSTLDENVSTIIVGGVNLLSTFVANALIDKLGRKILLYVSDVLMILSLFSLGTFFYIKHLSNPEDELNEWNETIDKLGWVPLVSFIVYVLAFSLGWGPIPWLFMGEALPTRIRGPAASLATTVNWSCTFLVTKTFPSMIRTLKPFGVFYMFGSVMVVGLFFSYFFVPETKGKTLEQIEAAMAGPSRRQRRDPTILLQ